MVEKEIEIKRDREWIQKKRDMRRRKMPTQCPWTPQARTSLGRIPW